MLLYTTLLYAVITFFCIAAVVSIKPWSVGLNILRYGSLLARHSIQLAVRLVFVKRALRLMPSLKPTPLRRYVGLIFKV